MKKNFFYIFFLSISTLFTIVQSCRQPEPPKGSIKVVIDSSGVPVPNVPIRITSTGSKGKTTIDGVDKVVTTNSSGQAYIEIKLDAIVQCYVAMGTGKVAPYDTLRGVKSLQLIKDKMNFVDTVTIRLQY